MRGQTILLAMFAATVMSRQPLAAPLFFVQDGGNIQVQVFTEGTPTIVADTKTVNTPQLQQLSVSSSATTFVNGLLHSPNPQSPRIQHADGLLQDTVQIGALHVLAKANATTNGFPYVGLDAATAQSRVGAFPTWFDTVTFHTTNPAGSDFTAVLTLDDQITNSSVSEIGAQPWSTGARVDAAVDIVGLPIVVFHPTLTILDAHFQHPGGPLDTTPPSFAKAFTFHVTNNESITVQGTLTVDSAALGGETGVVADASDTSRFLLFSSDPLASYQTASGVSFVPEPSGTTLVAVLMSWTAVMLRRLAKQTTPTAMRKPHSRGM